MPTVLDLIKAPEFADDKLTESINVPPYKTGRLAQLGVFTDSPIATTYVKLGIRDDEITIIPARQRGGPSNKNMRRGVKSTTFDIPHFPLDDAISPSDIQNLTAWGENNVMLTLANVYNDKLTSMRLKHDATHHHLDWGAINGLVLDASGEELLDLYEQFDLTQVTVDFALGTATTNLAARARAAKAEIRTQLRGTASTGVRVFAGRNFFDNYVNHKFWTDNLAHYPGSTPNPARESIEDTFADGNWVLERIDEEFEFRQADGTFLTRQAIGENGAVAIPMGTPFFKRYVAPPDTIADANNAPRPENKVYVSTDDLPHGKGRDIHTESNVLPVCIRPQIMVKLTMS